MSKLDKRLILTEWMFTQFGYAENGMARLREILKDKKLGWEKHNVFHFRRHLELLLPEETNRPIKNDDLIRYDSSISKHWQAVTKKRSIKEHRTIFPLHFQYLSLLFTEYFLDRWSRDLQQGETTLLRELNDYRNRFNERFEALPTSERNALKVPAFAAKDLS